MKTIKQILWMVISSALLVCATAQAMVVTDPGETTMITSLSAIFGSLDRTLAKILAEQVAMEIKTIADVKIHSEDMKVMAGLAGGIPNEFDSKALDKPDDDTLDNIREKHYDFRGEKVPNMCPGGVSSTDPKALVPNMIGYAALMEKMCKRILNLKAYKVRMTEEYIIRAKKTH
jgi:hypothetical protein